MGCRRVIKSLFPAKPAARQRDGGGGPDDGGGPGGLLLEFALELQVRVRLGLPPRRRGCTDRAPMGPSP